MSMSVAGHSAGQADLVTSETVGNSAQCLFVPVIHPGTSFFPGSRRPVTHNKHHITLSYNKGSVCSPLLIIYSPTQGEEVCFSYVVSLVSFWS